MIWLVCRVLLSTDFSLWIFEFEILDLEIFGSYGIYMYYYVNEANQNVETDRICDL